MSERIENPMERLESLLADLAERIGKAFDIFIEMMRALWKAWGPTIPRAVLLPPPGERPILRLGRLRVRQVRR